MTDNNQPVDQAPKNQPQGQLVLQRIYIKDLSFESPNSPESFKQSWQPKINLELNTKHNKIDNEQVEVILSLTIKATNNEKIAFIIEIQQAGLFLIKGINDQALQKVVGTICPNTLFPYAREVVDNLSLKGSFPPLMLAPVNFEALYKEAIQRKAQQATASSNTTKH